MYEQKYPLQNCASEECAIQEEKEISCEIGTLQELTAYLIKTTERLETRLQSVVIQYPEESIDSKKVGRSTLMGQEIQTNNQRIQKAIYKIERLINSIEL
jgi:hypothetical protein